MGSAAAPVGLEHVPDLVAVPFAEGARDLVLIPSAATKIRRRLPWVVMVSTMLGLHVDVAGQVGVDHILAAQPAR